MKEIEDKPLKKILNFDPPYSKEKLTHRAENKLTPSKSKSKSGDKGNGRNFRNLMEYWGKSDKLKSERVETLNDKQLKPEPVNRLLEGSQWDMDTRSLAHWDITDENHETTKDLGRNKS